MGSRYLNSVLSVILEKYSWVTEKKVCDRIFAVKASILSSFLNNRDGEKQNFIKDCSSCVEYTYLKFTELNDEIIEILDCNNLEIDKYFSEIPKGKIDSILPHLKIGSWTLFFSNEKINNYELSVDSFDANNLLSLGKSTDARLIVSSYLDDSEWLVYVA